jgi:hypothetical protein
MNEKGTHSMSDAEVNNLKERLLKPTIKFEQVQDSDTYKRWHSEPDKPAGHQTYCIAWYHWLSRGPTYKVDPHFSAYYHSNNFPGSERYDTFEEAEAACLAHFNQRMEELKCKS